MLMADYEDTYNRDKSFRRKRRKKKDEIFTEGKWKRMTDIKKNVRIKEKGKKR
jgi:hypothetical protein